MNSKQEQSTDYLDYKRYSRKVKEYLENFTFLGTLASLDVDQVIPFLKKVLESLNQEVQKSNLQILKTFKYLTWAAWKGRQEYKEKYVKEGDTGHECQISLLAELYRKSHLSLKSFSYNTTSHKMSTEEIKSETEEMSNEYLVLTSDDQEIKNEVDAEMNSIQTDDIEIAINSELKKGTRIQGELFPLKFILISRLE